MKRALFSRLGAMAFGFGMFGVLGATVSSAFAASPAPSPGLPCPQSSAPAPNALFADVSPAPGSSVPSDRPFVYVRFAQAVDPNRTRFRFDGTTYTQGTMRWSTGLLLLDEHVDAGCHAVDVSVTTTAGATSAFHWTFASGSTAAKTVLAYYDAPKNGDTVAGPAYVNGKAAAHARVLGIVGIGTSSTPQDGQILTNAAVKESTADELGTFDVAPEARLDTTHHGVLMIAAVDPVLQSISFGGVFGLHAGSRWCPYGIRHVPSNVLPIASLATLDRGQGQLCDGDYAKAESTFASDEATMRAYSHGSGSYWLDYAQSYFLTLLLTDSNDAAARLLRSVGNDRQPTAADRVFYAGRYDDASAAYTAVRKAQLANIASQHLSDDEKGSFDGFIAGNEAARERRWEAAFLAWMDAASLRHNNIDEEVNDAYDAWSLDALEMMYYYRAHIPK